MPNKIRFVDTLEVAGQSVFLRVDFNVPMKNGQVTDDSRIRAAVPTIKKLLESNARLALASHLGRPKGSRVPSLSLKPVGVVLSKLLNRDVHMADDCVGDGVKGLMHGLKGGELVLLENLRFQKGETKNDPAFARTLAKPFDVFVSDAFGTMHRAHASTVGMVPHCASRAAGFLVKKELEHLLPLLEKAEHPFRAVLGGAKVADKLGVIQNLLGRVDEILLGGAMAYTFLVAKGNQVGSSRVEGDKIHLAKEILARAEARKTKIWLPQDHVVAAEFKEDSPAQIIPQGQDIPAGRMGLDIGPATRAEYTERLRSAATIFWNGPMGVFEWGPFSAGTKAVAQAVAECSGYTVAGGGDSVAAINKFCPEARLTHVSTGGGASLEFLEGKELPGLVALKE